MRAALVACFLAVLASPAAAQERWEFAATLYGWLPGLDANIDTPFGEVETDSGGSDVLDSLDMAFMGTFEARHGRWGFILDALYTDLSDDKASPRGRIYSDARVETKVAALSGYAVYRVYESPKVSFDAGVGFRSFGVDLSTDLNSAGRAKDRSYDDDQTWTVPLIAARVIVPFNDKWFGTAYADLGGMSSDTSTWQAFASVGYRFNERWSMQLGYRYMDIEKEFSGLDVDLGLGGPLIGATYRF